MNNGGLFNPEDKTLTLSVKLRDVTLQEDGSDRILITVDDLADGIEIVYKGDRLWRPVE